MRVLIIDNNINPPSWGAASLKRLTLEFPGLTAEVRRAPQEDLPKNTSRYDAIVISGSKTSCLEDSPWVHQLDDLIRRSVNDKKPLLGVCYGHQSLNRALGGFKLMKKDAAPEIGWTEIVVTSPSKLFEGLPERFYTFSSHTEEVSSLAPGMKKLARSELCNIQACQLGDQPVYGIQFHPEKNIEEAKKTFENWRKASLSLGIKNLPLMRPNESEKLYNPTVGKRIFENFFKSLGKTN